LSPASDTANPKNVVSELKEKYGEGKVTELRYVQTVAKNSNAFQRGFLRAQMVCCEITLMTTRFATIVKNTSLLRCWNGPNLFGLCMDVDLSMTTWIFFSG